MDKKEQLKKAKDLALGYKQVPSKGLGMDTKKQETGNMKKTGVEKL